MTSAAPATAAVLPPELVRELAPAGGAAAPQPDAAAAFTVINFNTARQTLRCVTSLAACDEPPAWILVLDNASRDADFELLRQSLQSVPRSRILLYRSTTNLGFAGGSNFLVDEALRLPDCQSIGLLNNDAVALPGLTRALRLALAAGGERAGLAGGRMHRLAAPAEVDTLGIALFGSLMPADRKDTSVPFLGPSGGCCLMTRAFIDDLLATTGYFFDARYFCYCEDTDLVLRANLLGWRPVYEDTLLALHEGQASTGGRHNDFIAYHGLRNAMWMHCKLIPTALLWRFAHLLLLAHLLTMGRQIVSGRVRLLWRIYRDAFALLPEFRQERQRMAALRRIEAADLRRVMSGRFYRRGYAAVVLNEWKIRWRRSGG
jgi:GT2 family glycosyltransferase